MSKILRTASAVAVVATTLATLALTDASQAVAGQGDDPLVQQEEQLAGAAVTDGAIPAELAVDVDPIAPAGLDAETAEIPAPELPEIQTPASLTELVAMQPADIELSAEERCLAGTVYFESKGESLTGQLAVAEVVLARRDSPRFPNTICGVVYQRSQFSFVRGGRMPAIRTGSKAWQNAVAISQIAMNDHWESPAEGSLFFHARRVSPGWRLTRVAQIDNHIFYR